MALGVIAALTEAGRRVPDDVSVAGFDDVPDAAYFTPALTTVHQDFEALASRCVTLLERILRGESARSARVRPELVVRTSTAPPAGR
jgi:DNA-binding LacI/PurR family transcriptional regulator